jgi:predicted N-acyltransferase
LVTAIPYTPATGPRLLVAPGHDYAKYATLLIKFAIELAGELNMSTVHWLFTNERDTALLREQGMAMRLGCQFHWTNHGYTSFDHYLQSFSSQKRKQIKRERKRVVEQDIAIEVRHGDEMTDELWSVYHDFYSSTFDRKSGMATLSLDFFREIGRTLARNVVIVFARHHEKYVASAFNLAGETTLYGRHWGCDGHYHSLHFEACYYQGLDYCIKHGLQHFEPGAQGEHKISRGFLPTETWSAHWIANESFAEAIKRHTEQEQAGMQHYIKSLEAHSPFKQMETCLP